MHQLDFYKDPRIISLIYRNQKFPNNSHIYLIACDAALSWNYPSPITGSNIQKWDRILNCCSDFTMTNSPYLE